MCSFVKRQVRKKGLGREEMEGGITQALKMVAFFIKNKKTPSTFTTVLIRGYSLSSLAAHH